MCVFFIKKNNKRGYQEE